MILHYWATDIPNRQGLGWPFKISLSYYNILHLKIFPQIRRTAHAVEHMFSRITSLLYFLNCFYNSGDGYSAQRAGAFPLPHQQESRTSAKLNYEAKVRTQAENRTSCLLPYSRFGFQGRTGSSQMETATTNIISSASA